MSQLIMVGALLLWILVLTSIVHSQHALRPAEEQLPLDCPKNMDRFCKDCRFGHKVMLLWRPSIPRLDVVYLLFVLH